MILYILLIAYAVILSFIIGRWIHEIAYVKGFQDGTIGRMEARIDD